MEYLVLKSISPNFLSNYVNDDSQFSMLDFKVDLLFIGHL